MAIVQYSDNQCFLLGTLKMMPMWKSVSTLWLHVGLVVAWDIANATAAVRRRSKIFLFLVSQHVLSLRCWHLVLCVWRKLSTAASPRRNAASFRCKLNCDCLGFVGASTDDFVTCLVALWHLLSGRLHIFAGTFRTVYLCGPDRANSRCSVG